MLASDRSGALQGHLRFAVVRNPFDRLVSCYLQRVAPHTLSIRVPSDNVDIWAGMPFGDFVESIYDLPDEECDPHLRAQSAVLTRPDGTPLFESICYFERLEEDLESWRQCWDTPTCSRGSPK
jgi:hypothetical protein